MDQQLAALRACVEAVHGGNASDRAAAQAQLTAFEAHPTSWRQCIGFIRQERDPVVIAFLLNVMERVQVYRGVGMEPAERKELRNFVLEFAVAAKRSNFARFLVTKCAKIIVDAAKIDWPHNYPEFFQQVLVLCQDQTLRSLGLQVLLTTFEEWLATSVRRGRDVPMSSARRAALRKGLSQSLAAIMAALTEILRNGSAGGDLASRKIILEILDLLFASTISFQEHLSDGSLMNHLFEIISKNQTQSDNGDKARVVHCLSQMVGRNCIPRDAEGFVMQVSTQMLALLKSLTDSGSGGIQSVPEDFLLQLVRFLAVFLERHLGRVESQPNFPLTDLLALLFQFTFLLPTPTLFVEALSLWNVFVDFVISGKSDARRLQAYRSGLMQLSGKLVERMLFSHSGNFLSVLSDTPTGGGSGGGSLLMRGGQNGASGSGSFDVSQDNASEDEAQQMWSVTPPVRTELDDYLKSSFTLITSLVALPTLVEQLLSCVLPVLHSRAQTYKKQQEGYTIDQASGAAASRDICTLCGIVSAAAGYFVTPSALTGKVERTAMVYKCILEQIALPIVQLRTWARGHHTVELLVQCFRTLESFSAWIGLCLRPGSQDSITNLARTLLDDTAGLMALSLDARVSPAPEIVMVSAVQLARSILTIAKPSSNQAGRMYGELLQISSRASLPKAVRERTSACMAEVVLAGIAASSTLNTDEIRSQFAQVVGQHVQNIVLSAKRGAQEQQRGTTKSVASDSYVQNKIRVAAGNLAAVAWSRRNAPRGQKDLVFETIQPALQATGQLLHMCLDPVPQRTNHQKRLTSIGGMRTAKQLMVFLRFAMDSLRSQIGADTLCGIVVALCGVVKQYILGGLAAQTVSPSATLLALLVSVMRMFAVAVNDSSLKFRRVLPHVLGAISNFDAALFSSSSPVRAACMSSAAGLAGLDDVLSVRFLLFRICLLQHWTFFMGNNKRNKPPDPTGRAFFESSMRELLNTFIRAAQGGVEMSQAGTTDDDKMASSSVKAVAFAPAQVRFNLKTLQELHRVHRLFLKCPGEITGQCLTACLRLVASTGMELLQSEAISLVHKIAACDFNSFFESFLPRYIANTLQEAATPARQQQLLSQFDRESVDAISFGENCLNFLNGFQ